MELYRFTIAHYESGTGMPYFETYLIYANC